MSRPVSPPRSLFTLSRRDWLQLGSASALGLSLPKLLAARELAIEPEIAEQFGRAKSCVVIFLWGGPGQQDLWDMKPEAPSSLRSEFSPIATNVSGVRIGEHLPLTAKQADKYTIIRSMTHKDFEHGSALYTALTGQPHPLPGTNTTARPDDFPTYGSVVTKLAHTTQPVPDAVVLGPVLHQGARPPAAGQNGGFLGPGYDLFRIDGDPNQTDFKVGGVALPDGMTHDRFSRRQDLLSQVEAAPRVEKDIRTVGMQELYGRAFGLLGSAQAQQAFDLNRESSALRDRYGRSKFGQTLLLARRLIEAEVPLIQVNWSKLNADQWDTHKQNYPRLRKLLPPFDQGFSAFLDDLDSRGLLESTLVVCLGEFGRTPIINKDAGRDHWPDCYSVVVAGGGMAGGRVYGTSNRTAAYPTSHDMAPWDLAATMYHLMGIHPKTEITNRQGQPLAIARGRVVANLF